jgi:hypothetical protein
MAACDGIWGHCGKLEEVLQHSAIRTELLEERVHGPDGSRTAAMRAARAEAENEQLRSQLAHERRSVQRLSLQAMQINSQLMHAKASEAAMREGVERIKREFRASRLALLLRAARDRADRNEMEVYCKTLREWTIETLGDKYAAAHRTPNRRGCRAVAMLMERRSVSRRAESSIRPLSRAGYDGPCVHIREPRPRPSPARKSACPTVAAARACAPARVHAGGRLCAARGRRRADARRRRASAHHGRWEQSACAPIQPPEPRTEGQPRAHATAKHVISLPSSVVRVALGPRRQCLPSRGSQNMG